MNSGYILKADGPRRASCADLPEIHPSRFHKLGGKDITVWDTRYTVFADRLEAIGVAKLAGFETEISLPQARSYVAVEAIDRTGAVLGTSTPVKL